MSQAGDYFPNVGRNTRHTYQAVAMMNNVARTLARLYPNQGEKASASSRRRKRAAGINSISGVGGDS